MLYIRADGNAQIGTGHVMRCLSIADAVKKLGGEVAFIVADNHMSSLLSERGYNVICLDSIWDNMEEEAGKMVSLIKAHSIKKLLIDSYFVTHGYLQRLCDLTYVTYVDDLNAFRYPCAMLINYNCYADKFGYPIHYPGTKLLLGCEYAPLREEFQNLPSRVLRKKAQSVLVTAGGADPYNAAEKLVRNAKMSCDFKPLEFHVVAGRLNPHIGGLERLAREYDGIVIHRDVQNMSRLMLDCDVAVSAGGSTLYELCACGTPAVAFVLADNQIAGVSSFVDDGYMINAGDIRSEEELCLNRMLDGLRNLASDYDLRRSLARQGQALVDGKGALRIAEMLTHFGG